MGLLFVSGILLVISRGHSEGRPAPPVQVTPRVTLATSTPTPVAGQPTASKPLTPSPSPTSFARCPLDGEEIQDVALLHRRPLAVKIDNAPAARPQAGLSAACIVYEHLTEWGVTRFTAIFLHKDVDSVGPIRSARLVDLQLAAEYKAIFAHVGASGPIMTRLARSGILDLDEFRYGQFYHRIRERPAPYNVYTSSNRLRQAARLNGWEGEVSLDRSALFAESPASPEQTSGIGPSEQAQYIAIPYPGTSRVEYRYQPSSKSYLRYLNGEPQIDANTSEQLRVRNVIIQYAKTWPTDILEDIVGGKSLQIELTGEGKVEVFHNGRMISGKWVHRRADERTQFLTESGAPLALIPGNIWVSLVPPDYITIKR